MKIKIFSKFYQSLEPIHLLFAAVGLFVLIFFVFQYNYSSKSDLAVNYSDTPEKKEIKRKKDRLEAARLGETDPNTQLTARVTEANGIANGLLQFCLHRYFVLNKSVPANLNELLTEFQTSELKPPFVQKTTETGGLLTGRGSYFVRYSPKPLMISILGSGSDSRRDGAVFVLRTPDASAQPIADRDGIKAATLTTLYVAPDAPNGVIPQPFAVSSEFQNAGWTIEPLRLTDVTPDKLEAVNRMLSEVK